MKQTEIKVHVAVAVKFFSILYTLRHFYEIEASTLCRPYLQALCYATTKEGSDTIQSLTPSKAQQNTQLYATPHSHTQTMGLLPDEPAPVVSGRILERLFLGWGRGNGQSTGREQYTHRTRCLQQQTLR